MKKIKVFFVVIFAAVIFTSCRFSMFKKVEVKAKPELELNLGSAEFKTEDFISAKKISEMAGNQDLEKKIFKYKESENDNTLRFLFHHSIPDLGMDMSNNMDELKNLEKGIEQSIEKKFDIPDVENSNKKEITSQEINDKLIEAFNKREPELVDIYEQGTTSNTNIPESGADYSNIFQSAEFGEDSELEITGEPVGASDDFDINLTKAEIKKHDGTIIKTWQSSDPAGSKKVILDVSNMQIPSQLKIKMEGKVSGGISGKQIKLKIKVKFTKGRLKRVTGLNIDPYTYTIDPINVSMPQDFKEAKIKEGKLVFTKTFPAGWSGLNIDTSAIKAEQAGGLQLIGLTEGDNSLDGKTITENPLTVSGSVTISAVNANYEFSETEKAEFKFDLKVKEFDYVKVRMPNDFKLEHEETKQMPDEIKKWVKEIHFPKLKSEIRLDNKLPAGNDLKITISSRTFEMDENEPENTKTFPSAQDNTEVIEKTDYIFTPAKLNNGNTDIKVKIKFDGYDETNRILKLNNIKPKQSITLKGSVKISPVWDYAVIGSTEEKFKGKVPKEDGKKISLKALNEFIKPEMKFKDIQAYIYINSEVLKDNNAQLASTMHVSYNNKSGVEKKFYFIGDGSSEETPSSVIDLGKTLPESFLNHDKTKPFIGKIPDAAIEKNISEIINENPSEIEFLYKVLLKELKIFRKDLDKLKDKKTGIDVLVKLPASFKIESDCEFKKIEKNEDILKRSSKTENNTLKSAVDMSQKLNLIIDYNNTTGINLKSVIALKNKTGTPLITKHMALSKGKNKAEFELTESDIRKIQDTVPLFSEFTIILPKGDYDILDGSFIKIKGSISSKMNIDKTFDVL